MKVIVWIIVALSILLLLLIARVLKGFLLGVKLRRLLKKGDVSGLIKILLKSDHITTQFQVARGLTILKSKGKVDNSEIEEHLSRQLSVKGISADAGEIKGIVNLLITEDILRDGEQAYGYNLHQGLQSLHKIKNRLQKGAK